MKQAAIGLFASPAYISNDDSFVRYCIVSTVPPGRASLHHYRAYRTIISYVHYAHRSVDPRVQNTQTYTHTHATEMLLKKVPCGMAVIIVVTVIAIIVPPITAIITRAFPSVLLSAQRSVYPNVSWGKHCREPSSINTLLSHTPSLIFSPFYLSCSFPGLLMGGVGPRFSG